MPDATAVDGHAEDLGEEQPADSQTPAAPPPEPVSPGLELARRDAATVLIPATSPQDRIEHAEAIATTLADVIKKQGMRTKMGSVKKRNPETGDPLEPAQWEPRWHVDNEGWQTLAALLGCALVEEYVRPIRGEDGHPLRHRFTVKERITRGQGDKRTVTEREYDVDGFSWEAKYLVIKDGAVISSATGTCGRDEGTWKDREEFAVKGMAQTRSQSRAIAAAARWIVTLAGYSGTPAEEMPGHQDEAGRQAAEPPAVLRQFAPNDDAALGLARVTEGLAFLLDVGNGPEEEKAKEVVTWLIGDSGMGHMPRNVARAIVAAWGAAKALAEAEEGKAEAAAADAPPPADPEPTDGK